MRARAVLVAVLVSLLAAPAAAGTDGPVVCFYAAPPLEKLAAFRTVVLEPSLVTAANVAFLKSRGCRVLGYLSLGEDDRLRRGNGRGPGGHAAWYIDEHTGAGFAAPGADGKPDSNPHWGSYYVDPAHRAWRNLVRADVRHIRETLGMDGVFLDTVNLPRDVFTDATERRMAKGMRSMIAAMKRWSGDGYVLVNNGGSVAADLGRRIDGIMIETHVASPPDVWREVRLTLARLDPHRKNGLFVTALLYLPENLSGADACAALTAMSLPAAVYRDDAAGRSLNGLPLTTCP